MSPEQISPQRVATKIVNPYSVKRLKPSPATGTLMETSPPLSETDKTKENSMAQLNQLQANDATGYAQSVVPGDVSSMNQHLTSSKRNPYLVKKFTDESKGDLSQLVESKSLINKFIGGAELARRNARRKLKGGQGNVIMRPGEVENNRNDGGMFPFRMSSMDRFFAALLISSPFEYYESEKSDSKAKILWEKICKRVGVAMPTAPIQPVYESKQVHFDVRAALVLEESRAVLSKFIEQYWKNSPRTFKFPLILTATPVNERRNSNSYPQITFYSHQFFSKDDLFNIRPGSVFQFILRESEKVIHNVLLGVVLTGNREQVEKKKMFTCMFFREDALPIQIENTEWVASHVTQLVTELRSFEAMTNNPGDVPFWADLMGKQKPRHTRFYSIDEQDKNCKQEPEYDILMADSDESDSEMQVIRNELKSICKTAQAVVPGKTTHKLSSSDNAIELLSSDDEELSSFPQRSDDSTRVELPVKIPSKTDLFDVFNPQQNRFFKLSLLNESQERAASEYLKSNVGSITLIQGPPGTGKTTLLVSVICRYLSENVAGENKKRLMVCAPTNKAVSLLATRFISAYKENCSGTFNAIMVGDADKLLSDDRSRHSSSNKYAQKQDDHETSQLKSIFLYTWIQNFVDEYKKIKQIFVPGSKERGSLQDYCTISTRLEERLLKGMPHITKEISTLASKVSTGLKKLINQESIKFGSHAEIVKNVDLLIKQLQNIPQETVWTQLLQTADVIFCTLASAGGAVLKKTDPIDDLIVDEAAAATEPELCIPLHLKPSRLLVVGDPLQLPATVTSRKAIELGLTKSLHERLMNDCNFDYTMLETQYRMNPEISVFPSSRFYKAQIKNGENVCCAKYSKGALLLDKVPYRFIQVNGMEQQNGSGSYMNRAEALQVVQLIIDLQRLSSQGNHSWYSSDRIRVITFYQAQVSLIKNLLFDRGIGDKIVVATVDSSQGCEADTVIISFVRSQLDSSEHHNPGFLTDNRRINVALTRAKYQLICVGNVSSFTKMKGAETLHMLSTDAQERDVILSSEENHNHRSNNNRPYIRINNNGWNSPNRKRTKFQ